MKTKEIEIQIEKLRVIKGLLQEIETEDSRKSTREMLLELRDRIDVMLENDF
jgi:hypothetical protein